MAQVTPVRLAEIFVQVADTLVDDFDVIDFLGGIAAITTEVAGVTAVGLMLAEPSGQLLLMAASDERTEMLELFQVQNREGPCQDCFNTGEPVVATNLADAADRWPVFAPQAAGAGFRSVHAFPMRLRREVIGALNLFNSDTGDLQPEDARIIQGLADIATIGILQERAIERSAQTTEQLQGALNSRVVIEQAKGALAQLHGVTPDEAFALLRTYCRDHGLKLGGVARSILDDPSGHPDLKPQAPPREASADA
jgi:GAF domain-containing protein